MDRKLYMYVTTDEYELPIAVGTLAELASGLGMKQETIKSYLYSKRETKHGKFIKLGFTDKEVREDESSITEQEFFV